MLFPNKKKNKKSPDYRGSINDENREKVVDVIYYIRKPKTGGYYFSGYLFYPEDTVKTTITVETDSTEEDNNKPAITGKLEVGADTYKIALWKKLDKNGQHYYSGKISL